jgi:hypothetical protein
LKERKEKGLDSEHEGRHHEVKVSLFSVGSTSGAARTGTLPEFWTPGLSLILGMSTADQILSSVLDVPVSKPAEFATVGLHSEPGPAGVLIAQGGAPAS